MSLRIKRLPAAVKQTRKIIDKQQAMQRFVDSTVESMGYQLTVSCDRIEGQENRRFTAYYNSHHRLWQLQVENPTQDMEIGQKLLVCIAQRVAAEAKSATESNPKKPSTSSAMTASESGIPDTGNPPVDSKGDGPKGIITGGG